MDEKQTKEAETVVRVAQVSSRAAVVVALITTIGGAIAGYLLRPPTGAPIENRTEIGREPPRIHWLTVERIETVGTLDVRLVVTVNGLKFSYPSSSVWQELRPGMPSNRERFLLPLAEGSYRVSFSAFLSHWEEAGSGEAISATVDEVAIKQLPSGTRPYDLYGMVRTFTRGSEPNLKTGIRVFYSIE